MVYKYHSFFGQFISKISSLVETFEKSRFWFIIIISFRSVYFLKLNGNSIQAVVTVMDLPFGRQNDIISLLFTQFSEHFHNLVKV